ncbi:MAG TPA: fatty acid cis/trans isomerase [Pseudomonadales bacterium]
MKRLKLLLLCLLPVILSGCAAWERYELNTAYGKPRPVDRLHSSLPADELEYYRDIRPLMESRCTVCHGCYDAPCQLKLDARAGLERGASKDKVYDGTRLLAANMSRLFVDAQSTAEWRAKGFFPVLNEREQTPEANAAGSVMYQMLRLKEKHPLPAGPLLPDSFDLSLDRDQQCATIEEFPRFADNYPLWGMPYGFPGLSKNESGRLMRWIKNGSPAVEPAPPGPAFQAAITRWETLLNGDSLKAQLSSRYIYEHLFYSNLYFSELPAGTFFRIVRSATAPGKPIQVIATRRPYDDPGVPRVYYRLEHNPSTVLDKTNMPYALNAQRMQRWKQLFFDAPFSVDALPGYSPEIASNPFAAFQSLPAEMRYRFMLDDAQMIIQGFIKGPVCRGQLALNVIDDRFWVIFINPDIPESMDQDGYLATHQNVLRLPSDDSNNALPITTWLRYAELQREWLQAKGAYFQEHYPSVIRPTLSMIWDGNGQNPNAGLTVFRHFDSATVTQGFVGGTPKTAWLIGYPLLERLHYLLVAGFDVYGNVSHQLLTRLYMDFLRMEGEANFLLLLPEDARQRELAFWYRGANEKVMPYVNDHWMSTRFVPSIDYRTDHPKAELFKLLANRMPQAFNNAYVIKQQSLSPEAFTALHSLDNIQGAFLANIPETTFLLVQTPHGDQAFTILLNSAFKNLNSLFDENKRRIPAEDTLTVAAGFIGAYPNTFLRAHEKQLPVLMDRLGKIRSAEDFTLLMNDYGVRRTNNDFWAFSDTIQKLYYTHDGVNAGLFDYNRVENR